MSMYYEFLAAMRKEMWSTFYDLVDAAVMVAEGEESKGRKTVSEGEKERKKRKTRSSLVVKRGYSQQNHETLNGASPDPIYESSPSSCLTEDTSPNKRKSSGKFKRAKIAPLPRRVPRETPEWLVKRMEQMKEAQDLRLIFETALSASDVNPTQSRLLIPFRKLLRNDFLTPAESRALAKEAVTKEDDRNIGVGTFLVNQRSKEKWGLRFKIWVMKKDSGNGTLNYALNWDWNKFVRRNHLKADDEIRLWTFRSRGILCFALGTE